MIEQYFQSLLDLLSRLPFIESPDVSLEKRGELVSFIRGQVGFSNGSELFFRELIDLRLPLQKVMYAYHYQEPDGVTIFRYDNTAHHQTISTFPFHKHLQNGEVISASVPSLEEVLREIEQVISKG